MHSQKIPFHYKRSNTFVATAEIREKSHRFHRAMRFTSGIFNDPNNRFNARLRLSLFRVISVSSRYSSNERRLPSRSQGPEVPRARRFAGNSPLERSSFDVQRAR